MRQRIALVAGAVSLVVAVVIVVLALVLGREFRYDDPLERFPPSGPAGTGQEVRDAPGGKRDLAQFLDVARKLGVAHIGEQRRNGFVAQVVHRAGELAETLFPQAACVALELLQ